MIIIDNDDSVRLSLISEVLLLLSIRTQVITYIFIALLCLKHHKLSDKKSVHLQ